MTWIIEKFLSVCASYWRECLIGLLLCALWLTTSHFKTVTVELEDDKTKLKIQLAQQEQSFATQVALAKEKEDEATRTYAATVETIKARHAVAIKDIEQRAFKNYVARYGVGGVVLGLTGGLRNTEQTGVRIPVPAAAAKAGKDASTRAPDATPEQLLATRPEGEFVAGCARDAMRLGEWIQLCQLNQCEVVE